MELKIDNFIRVSGHDQYLIMKERFDSSNETYTVIDVSKEGSNNEDYYFLILDNKKEKQNKEFNDKWMTECTEVLKSIKLLENYWEIFDKDTGEPDNKKHAYLSPLISEDMIKRNNIIGAIKYLKTAEDIKSTESSLFDKSQSVPCKEKYNETRSDEPQIVRSLISPGLWEILESLERR